MKKLILSQIIFILLTATAQAAQISVGTIEDIYIADNPLGISSNTDFVDWNGQPLTEAGVKNIITSNPASFVSRSVADNSASFDLGFNGFNLFNGGGDDLVIFIVGNGSSFDLDVFDTGGANVLSNTYTVNNTVFDSEGNWLCVNTTNVLDINCTSGYPLSAILIDFGDSLAGNVALDRLHITLNDAEFALAGGFHIAPVPLPLSAVLFSSGLALLGWFGRKRTA